ncbi:MAG: amino acid adenylation domain-containing protein [Caulobacteraceae bacterium]
MNIQFDANFGSGSQRPDGIGIDAIFRRQADRRPAAIAIIYGAQEISYAELDRRANYLAAQLVQRMVNREQPIGILVDPGPDQIICQLAVIRAGGSCLPLDPEAPDERLKFMLTDLQTSIVLTTAAWGPRVAQLECILMEDRDSWPSPMTWQDVRTGDTPGAEHRTHVLFTSGTTGRPKGVEILARGIIRLTVDTDYVSLGPDDRIATIANPTFDASLFEIWGALLNGGTVIVLPKQTFIDPYALRHSLCVQRITTMFMTAALFNQTVYACPDAFRGLRQLLVGGEALNPRTLRAVLQAAPPQRLLNAYGPTESTTFTSFHEVSLEDVEAKTIPIGKPIDKTQIFLLDEARLPVPEGEVGEIYIGGDGLARGYWNRPELNAERFVEASSPIDGRPTRLYRTGDLGSWDAGNTLYFHGRNDNQVKIHGHRIEIEEIEAVLLASGLLRDAAVTVPQTKLGDKYLMAFVTPCQIQATSTSPSAGEGTAEVDDRDLLDRLARHVAERLPTYMRPRLRLVPALPMNANGKIDRRALIQHYAEEAEVGDLDAGEAGVPGADQNPDSPLGPTGTQAVLSAIWRRTLDIGTVGADDDFFQLGGDSLRAASLVLQVSRRFNYPLPVQVLYDHPTPAGLARHLDSRAQLNGGLATGDQIAALLADSRLPEDIQPLPETVGAWLTAGRVVLTGATGFLGAFVLRDLLQMPEVRQVACLVRAANDADVLVRIRNNMTKYGLWEESFSDRLLPLAGDLEQADLGLGRARFDELSKCSDVIFHLAAHVNYIQPYSTHRPANVTGTINILRFATTGKIKPLHYSSTIAAFGPAGLVSPTAVVYEDDDMQAFLTGLKFDSGYSQSQWVVEQLVWQAVRRGVPVAVYRPGFIMGDSRTGAGNPNDFVARLVKGCIAIGAYPVLPRQGKQFVPVDFVSKAMLRIASDQANLGRAYHLTPPSADAQVDLMGFFSLLTDCGYQLEPSPYQQWIRVLGEDRDLEQNPLMPLLPMLAEPVYGQLTRWEVYEGMPVYDTANTERALAASGGVEFPCLDRALLQRYLEYWMRIGFLTTSKLDGAKSESMSPSPGLTRLVPA